MYHSYTLFEILSRKRGFNKERCAQCEGRNVTYHSRVFCHRCRYVCVRMRQQRCAAMSCLFHVYPTPVTCMLNIEMCSLHFISKLISCFYLYLRFIHCTFTFLFYSQTLQRIKIENPLYDQSKAVKCISIYFILCVS